MQVIESTPQLIDKLYQQGCVSNSEVGYPYIENDTFILKHGSQSAICRFKSNNLHLVQDKTCFDVEGRSAEQKVALDLLTDNDVPLVTLTGKAGSGKTLLSLAAALEDRQKYGQIMVARPIVSLGGKQDIGFIPGSLEDKLKPWMYPIFDNLMVFGEDKGKEKHIQELLKNGKIELCPLTYVRGRSFNRMFVLIDEAQNLSRQEIKAIASRAGEDTKIVFTGDTDQVDLRHLDNGKDGLTYLVNCTVGHRLAGHVKLMKGERSPLATMIAEKL